MKKLSYLAALVCSLNSYASGDELSPKVVFQGDYSGVSVNYRKDAPIFIDNTKNGYYEAKLVVLSGDKHGLEFDHFLAGISYGVSDKINEQFNWFGQVGLAYLSNEFAINIGGHHSSADESGLELLAKGGVTSSLNDKVDYQAYLTIEDESALGLGATYKQSNQLQLVGNIETFGDTRFSFGVNYRF